MKAMIFAAGLGTRLRPVTDHTPKALVPINGVPLLEILITKLKNQGFNKVLINVHHFAEQVVEFIRLKNNFNIELSFSDETDRLLDTGGGIKKARSFFDDNAPFLIHNVDILTDVDLGTLYRSHMEIEDAGATLLVSERTTSRYLLFDKYNNLQGWTNKTTGEIKSPYPDFVADQAFPYAFGGVHVFSPTLFPYMDKWGEQFSIIDFYLSVADKVNIKAFINNEMKWLDVGKVSTLKEAELFSDNSLNTIRI